MGTNKDLPVKKNAFVHKLFTMLHDDSLKHLIWWSGLPCGITFSIYPGNEFALMLSKYFKHGNVASFVRQLHMYGFHKVSDPSHLDQQRVVWEFRHSSGRFRRGDESSLVHIRRRPQSNLSRSHMVDTNQATQGPPPEVPLYQPSHHSIPGGHPQAYSLLPAYPHQAHFIQQQPQASALHHPLNAPHFDHSANSQNYNIVQPHHIYHSPHGLPMYPQPVDGNFIASLPYGSPTVSPGFSQHRPDNQPYAHMIGVKTVHSPQQANFDGLDSRGFQFERHADRTLQGAVRASPQAHQYEANEMRQALNAQTVTMHSYSKLRLQRSQQSVVSPTTTRLEPPQSVPQSDDARKSPMIERASNGFSRIPQTPLTSSGAVKTTVLNTNLENGSMSSFPGFWEPFESSRSRQHRIPSLLCDPLAPLASTKQVSGPESNAPEGLRNSHTSTPLATVREYVKDDESPPPTQERPSRAPTMAPPTQGSLSHFRASQSSSVGQSESENMRKAILQANGPKSLADKIRPSLVEIHSSQGPYAGSTKSMESIGSYSSSVFSNNSSISSASTGRLLSYGSISYLPPPIGFSAVSPHEELPSYFRPAPLQKVNGLDASNTSIQSQSETEVDVQEVKSSERPFNSQLPKVEFMLSRRENET